MQVIFENHKPPAVFMARNAVLSSFASGRQTSLVVDMGHEGTTGARPLQRSWSGGKLYA